nr:hypothetical protein B7L51_14795 [Pectobacterium carotovorum]
MFPETAKQITEAVAVKDHVRVTALVVRLAPPETGLGHELPLRHLSAFAAFVVVLIRWGNVPDTHSPSGKQTGG